MVLVVVVSFGIMIYHMALIYMIATSDSAAAVKSNVMLIGSVAASVATVIFIIIFGMVQLHKNIRTQLTRKPEGLQEDRSLVNRDGKPKNTVGIRKLLHLQKLRAVFRDQLCYYFLYCLF